MSYFCRCAALLLFLAFYTFSLVASHEYQESKQEPTTIQEICDFSKNFATYLLYNTAKNMCSLIKHLERNKHVYGPVIFIAGASIAAGELFQDDGRTFVCPLTLPACWQTGWNGLVTEWRNFLSFASPVKEPCFSTLELLSPDSEDKQNFLSCISGCEVLQTDYYVKLVYQAGEVCIYQLTNEAGAILNTLVYGNPSEICLK